MMTTVSATLLKNFGAPIRSEFGAWSAPKKYDPYKAYAYTVIFRCGDRREENFSFPAFSTFNPEKRFTALAYQSEVGGF